MYLIIGNMIPYNTDAYINNERVDTTVDLDKLIIDGVIYNYYTRECDGETIIVAKEISNVLHMLHFFIPCLICPPKFMVLTSKEEP